MFTPPPRKHASRRFALSLVATATVSTFIFVACKKEAGPMAPSDPVGMSEQDDYEPRIRDFVALAQNPTARDGSMLTADSAEWYIEAALNFSNANTTLAYNESRVDSLTYHLPALVEGVAVSDAAAAFTSLNTQVASGNVADVSHVIIVDVTTQRTTTGVDLTIAYATGSGYDKALNTTYGSNDHWAWGGGGSNCNCSPNPNAGTCADKKIQQRINNELVALGQNVYMVSVESWTIMPTTNVPTREVAFTDYPVSGSPYGYRSFGCSGAGCNTCLSPSDMSFFTQGTWDVMNLIRQQYCPTKKAQHCVVDGNMSVCDECDDVYWHQARFYYGIVPKAK